MHAIYIYIHIYILHFTITFYIYRTSEVGKSGDIVAMFGVDYIYLYMFSFTFTGRRGREVRRHRRHVWRGLCLRDHLHRRAGTSFTLTFTHVFTRTFAFILTLTFTFTFPFTFIFTLTFIFILTGPFLADLHVRARPRDLPFAHPRRSPQLQLLEGKMSMSMSMSMLR